MRRERSATGRKQTGEEGHELAVITISGKHDEESGRKTLELGAADFITKPLDLEYLEVSLLAKLIAVGLWGDRCWSP